MQYLQAAQQLYVAFFGRPADPGGRVNFAVILENLLPGLQSIEDVVFNYRSALAGFNAAKAFNPKAPVPPILQLLSSFTTAPETIALYNPSGDPETFVRAVYRNVLGREIPPSDDGLQFWVGKIQTGQLDPAFVSLEILYAALRDDGKEGVIDFDRISVLNKTRVAEQITASIDTPEGIEKYRLPQAELARQLLNKVNSATDPAGFAVQITDLEEVINTTTLLTFTQALATAELPAKFAIVLNTIVRELGVTTVADLPAQLARVKFTAVEQEVVNKARNASIIELKASYVLADTLDNLLASSAAGVVSAASEVRVLQPASLVQLLSVFDINNNTVATRLLLKPEELFVGNSLVSNPKVVGLVANAEQLQLDGAINTDQFAALNSVSKAQLTANVLGPTGLVPLLNASGVNTLAPLINDGGMGLVQKTLQTGATVVTRLEVLQIASAEKPLLKLAGLDAQFFEIDAVSNILRVKQDQLQQAQNAAAQREGQVLAVEVTSLLGGLAWTQKFQVAYSSAQRDDASSNQAAPKVIEALSVFEGKIFDPNPQRFSNEDFDYFQVQFKAGQLYKLGASTDAFVDLAILDRQTGAELFPTRGFSRTNALDLGVRFEQDQTAVLKLRGLSFNGANSYTLKLSPDLQDQYSSDLNFAASLSLGAVVSDRITSADADIFKLSMEQGKRYVLSMDMEKIGATFFNGVFGSLQNPARQFVSIPRQERVDTPDNREKLTYIVEPASTGEYFFSVLSSSQTIATDYQLTFRNLVQIDGVADFETGAQLVETNKLINSRIDHAEDFDYYKVNFDKPGEYKLGFIKNSEDSSTERTLVRVYSDNGSSEKVVFAIQTFSGFGGSTFTLNIEEAGTYFVEFSGADLDATAGNYRFFVSDQTTKAAVEPSDTFDVVFNYVPELAYLKPSFDKVATLFSSLIIAGLPDWTVSSFGEQVDFVADVVLSEIDRAAVATGGPRGFLDPEFLGGFRTQGIITFDTADLSTLVTRNRFEEVLAHELMHALGIGTSGWTQGKLLDDRGYIGENALNAFRMLTGDPFREFVPLSEDRAHWSEFLFQDELMTPNFSYSAEAAISILTLAGLADQGYSIDYSKADDYMLLMS